MVDLLFNLFIFVETDQHDDDDDHDDAQAVNDIPTIPQHAMRINFDIIQTKLVTKGKQKFTVRPDSFPCLYVPTQSGLRAKLAQCVHSVQFFVSFIVHYRTKVTKPFESDENYV